ncbi:MAG: hypothetical protein ACTHMY_18090 [Solirubrobacteraceae bacterium]
MGMTPTARREAIRLMLLTFRETERLDRFDLWHFDEPHQERVSHRALKAALLQLLKLMPQSWPLLARYMQDWRSVTTQERVEIDRTLDWLAERMPAWIVISDGKMWELRWTEPDEDDDGSALAWYDDGDIPAPPPHVARELLAVWRAADAEHRTDDDDWSGPAPHAGEDATGSLLVAIYGETGPDEDAGYHITRKRAPAEHGPGRPRRGSLDPERAEELLLELCPGHTLDELRAALARGRPSKAARETRPVVSAAIREIRQRKRATPEALAEALRCDARTIRRLAS